MALTDRDLRSQTDEADDCTPRSRWVGARMTLDEFLALPEEETSLEFDDGLVTQKMAPQEDHGALQVQIIKRLDLVGEARQLGKVFSETRIVTAGWSPVPDVSYYRKEHIRPQTRRRIGKLDLPPDIAVEIISPGQSLGETIRKCQRYAGLGVAISLVVDPQDETVYDVRPGEPLRVLRGDDQIDLEPVLPGFDLTVQALFDSIVDSWLIEEAPAEQAPAAE
jgi:Uma2 family endonuclease